MACVGGEQRRRQRDIADLRTGERAACGEFREPGLVQCMPSGQVQAPDALAFGCIGQALPTAIGAPQAAAATSPLTTHPLPFSLSITMSPGAGSRAIG